MAQIQKHDDNFFCVWEEKLILFIRGTEFNFFEVLKLPTENLAISLSVFFIVSSLMVD